MTAIVEIIGAISILTAVGFLIIYVKESFIDQPNKSELNLQKTGNNESFINMNVDSLINDISTETNPEVKREKRKRLESFRLRNKFYYSK
ncbi:MULTISPECIES: hypothetical protein [Maribacter]|uniref:Uncharacterized protein n=2 Tax=Maribacter TaxID=252356 RepID=A0A5B2U0G2_9FLAO|nr:MULTISPECIES: hypothetical protein [Maribacter]KAA2219843.1 hypothetical protein F0361_09730 [Maribacter flavus]MDC6405240.1 hypothetical protein [Maribacter sp. PR66]MEE1971951.1 hypothetical protein [Maribacter flavus]TLF47059.1 hypothetical protein FEK29_04655 [Maribacter aurantiacus]